MLEIDPKVDSFLRQTVVAVLGTISDTGPPQLTPMWFAWEDDGVYMFTSRTSTKWRNIQVRPYGSLCVDRRDTPYVSVIVSGTIAEVDRPVYEVVSSMALRYYGEIEGQKFADKYKDNPSYSVALRLTPQNIVHNFKP